MPNQFVQPIEGNTFNFGCELQNFSMWNADEGCTLSTHNVAGFVERWQDQKEATRADDAVAQQQLLRKDSALKACEKLSFRFLREPRSCSRR